MQHLSTSSRLGIFAKIDFSKAFDSVDWEFLLEIMRTRKFPIRWIKWMEELLFSAQSAVVVNGETTDFIRHRRGLRQGDPLSPMLFIIATDVFQQMIAVTNSVVATPLSARHDNAIIALQYADDTAVIANAEQRTLIIIKVALRVFAKASGLEINFGKSGFVPINLTEMQIEEARAILGFANMKFPVTYLGMSLSINTLRRQEYLPLIEKLEKRLAGWRGKMISRGGKLQLVKSVLSTIPVYFMTCFLLPQWVIQRIDQIRKSFLWGKNDKVTRGISLINWELVCLPTDYGGMGGT